MGEDNWAEDLTHFVICNICGHAWLSGRDPQDEERCYNCGSYDYRTEELNEGSKTQEVGG